MTTAELLAEHARLMNAHGADAVEVQTFVLLHDDDEEFLELAEVSRDVKRALMRRRAREIDP